MYQGNAEKKVPMNQTNLLFNLLKDAKFENIYYTVLRLIIACSVLYLVACSPIKDKILIFISGIEH